MVASLLSLVAAKAAAFKAALHYVEEASKAAFFLKGHGLRCSEVVVLAAAAAACL